jgi:LuxR family transcriptional regulator, maltose regulon positive regulatory protein
VVTIPATLTLQALALWEKDEKERGVSTVTRALALAEPEGYVRTFADEGSPMAEILSATLHARQRNMLELPIPSRYLRKLLAALEPDGPDAGSPKALPDPPSERELEVLTLVAAGKSNRRIASDLFVSVGTVKTHVNNLYRKLDAHSRTQAVAKARDLKLL